MRTHGISVDGGLSRPFPVLAVLATLLAVGGCSSPAKDANGGAGRTVEIRRLPLDSLAALRTRENIWLDRERSADGKGSIRVTVTGATVVHLYEMGPIDIENARLIYQAKVRTAGLEGKTYLEMWCHFAGRGEFFSRGLHSALTGSTEWTTLETPFLLRAGERPDAVRLNLVVTGSGTVWIDDIRLLRSSIN